MSDSRALCSTCGSQYGSIDPPERCIICDEERQFIGRNGQRWTTAAELSKVHKNTWEEIEPGLFAIGVEPKFGIGQRCYLITTGKQTQRLHSAVMKQMLLSASVCTYNHQSSEQLDALTQFACSPALFNLFVTVARHAYENQKKKPRPRQLTMAPEMHLFLAQEMETF